MLAAVQAARVSGACEVEEWVAGIQEQSGEVDCMNGTMGVDWSIR